MFLRRVRIGFLDQRVNRCEGLTQIFHQKPSGSPAKRVDHLLIQGLLAYLRFEDGWGGCQGVNMAKPVGLDGFFWFGSRNRQRAVLGEVASSLMTGAANPKTYTPRMNDSLQVA